jgi:hypothetical protein
MNKYANLLAECRVIQDAWGYDFLAALSFILDMEDEYPSEVRRELREFMRDGARMFATKEAA